MRLWLIISARRSQRTFRPFWPRADIYMFTLRVGVLLCMVVDYSACAIFGGIWILFYLSGPGRGAEHCNQSVCLYVCMSRNVYQKSQDRTSLNFRRMLHVTVPGSSYGGVTICLCISGFVDDVMFTHRIGGGVRCLRLPCFVTDHLVVQANQSVVCMFVCPFVRMITFKRNGVLLRSDQPIRSWTWVKVYVA